jgi:hypothetical protein
MPSFIWISGNVASATKHGVPRSDAEHVVLNYLVRDNIGGDLYRAVGQSESGQYIEVVFRYAPEDANIDWSQVDMLAMDDDEAIFIFHARPLTNPEKRQIRRRMR